MFEDNHDCSSTTALAASYFCLARFRIIQDIFTLATKLSLFYRRSNYTALVYASGDQIYSCAVQYYRCLLFCTSGNNKQPRKCQQYLPVLLQRILLLQHLMVAFKKMLLFALGQILQPWT